VRGRAQHTCDRHTNSDSETSADDADASTNAVVATVSTPAIDLNDCEVCLIAQRDERIQVNAEMGDRSRVPYWHLTKLPSPTQPGHPSEMSTSDSCGYH